MHTAIEIVRIVGVLALVAVAAVLLTPKGRVPLALRGLSRMLGKDANKSISGACEREVPFRRRFLGMLLIAFAFALAVIRI